MPTMDESNVGVAQTRLRAVVIAAKRRWMMITAVLIVAVGAGIAYSATKHKLYMASGSVEISRQNLASELTDTSNPNQVSDFSAIVQTQADVARSPDVAKAAVSSVRGQKVSYRTLLANSTVHPAPAADLLTFQVRSENPQLAVELVNKYAAAYVSYRIKLDTSSITLASQQLQSRIANLTGSGSDEQLKEQLSSKQQQLQELGALQSSNASVTAQAFTAEQIAPRPVKYISLSVIAGLVLAALAVWLRESLDTRLRGYDEVAETLGAPTFGHIPPPPKEVGRGLVMLEAPTSVAAEPIRLLRSQVQLSAAELKARTLMITSAINSEGKSTTLCNLAVALARAEVNVALVDLDLRRPSVHRLFGQSLGPGVTDVLAGRQSLDDAMTPIEVGAGSDGVPAGGALAILRSGPIPSAPGEVVASSAVSGIVAELTARFDLVLIDAPPALITGDAAALSRNVDGVLAVVRSPVVTRPMLSQFQKATAGFPATLIGFVMTGQHSALNDYVYGYGYGDYFDSAAAAEGDQEFDGANELQS